MTRIELEASHDQAGLFIRDLENKFPTGEVRSLAILGLATANEQRRVEMDLALLVRPETPAKPPAKSETAEQKKKS